MLTTLRAARADASYDRKLLRFTAPNLLLVDDLGLRPLTHDEPLDLYEIIRQRYQHGATIITSNATWRSGTRCSATRCSPAPRWTGCSTTPTWVIMDGDTYRNPPPAKRARRGNGRAAAG